MKKELFELDELACFVNDRIKKLDWLIFQLMETATGDDAIVASLATDTAMTTSQQIEKMQVLISKLREQTASKADLECLQSVA
ncbi:hypothetical protein MOMA_09211 [Moraxella macacae 0408225]|uniref:Uncharacterized protein n=1 Tax=Moraxella macacae 0408225 TaxID=1230338 RepID=L2F7I5_9GAMM|nr:hypothetical protein [Moraxella macacae]ELA08726.1 hypothetical protein MOMA_09211 [Moraxella macacae 0408225]